jgi:hypothetical protein
VFWYKADAHNDFRLGSKEFWELSKSINDDEEDEQYDPNNVKKRGQGPKIAVKKIKMVSRIDNIFKKPNIIKLIWNHFVIFIK